MDKTDNGAARQTLQAQLNDPATAEALSRLLARMESLDKLAAWAELAVVNGPALLGTAVEEMDYAHSSGNNQFPDVDALMNHGPGVVQQLSSARTLQALERLLARMDALERSTAMLTDAVENGPAIVASLVDRLDQLYRDPTQPTPDIDALLEYGPTLSARLTSPATLQTIDNLLSRMDVLEQSINMLTVAVESGPAIVASLVDEVDQRAKQVDFERLMQEAADVASQFYAWYEEGGLDEMRDSGIFDPNTVEVMGNISRAMLNSLETTQKEAAKVGPMGLVGALRDEDVQRTLAFMITFAKQFGKSLQ